MATWKKYLLLQIPGWLATAAVLAMLWHWRLLPRSVALVGLLAWLVKDLILYPLVRHAYEDGPKTGSLALVGARGVAEEALNPSGYVRIRGELWRAVTISADRAVAPGADVEVIDAKGMSLFVRPLPELRRDGAD